ncbi:MAG TPA: CoA transferase [Xanthobacteraceae bacterium]|jgi:formyl-CoA transferase|nr:CoA transferase [Xanthobacteraceae bacterium]
MPAIHASDVLARFTVLDLTQVRSGPTAVRQLADWGANVIKIEPPAELAPGEGPGGPREGPDFQNIHRNKRAITLNLKSPEGLKAFYRMAEKADVVVENFRPDVKARLKIDYDTLKALNPRIICASISGFGQSGPYSGRPGFDQIAQGMGGLMSITGKPGDGPMRVGIPIADLTAGIFCAMGVLLALIEREQSGIGQKVDTSLLQAQIFMLDFQAARWLMKQEVPGQAGNNHPTAIPTGVFKTKDGYINIASTGDKMWQRLCEAIGAPEFLECEEYATGALRSQNRNKLNDGINERLAKKTSTEWIDILNTIGVPCGPINTIDKVFADPQVQHLGMAKDVTAKDGHNFQIVGQPVALSRTPSRIVSPTPEQGEHTDEVFAEFGFSAEEVAALRRAKAI